MGVCQKCNGTGYISKYRHVKNGICFDCDGEGTLEKHCDQLASELAAEEHYYETGYNPLTGKRDPYGSDYDDMDYSDDDPFY